MTGDAAVLCDHRDAAENHPECGPCRETVRVIHAEMRAMGIPVPFDGDEGDR